MDFLELSAAFIFGHDFHPKETLLGDLLLSGQPASPPQKASHLPQDENRRQQPFSGAASLLRRKQALFSLSVYISLHFCVL